MHTLISKSKVVSLGLNKNKGAFKSPQMYGIFKEKTKKKQKEKEKTVSYITLFLISPSFILKVYFSLQTFKGNVHILAHLLGQYKYVNKDVKNY